MVALDELYSSAFSLIISQPLLKGNNRAVQTAGVRSAEKYTQAASYLVENQAADLAAQVKKAYWDLVFARQDIEVKELSLKLARNLHEETRIKIESGVLAEVEIYQPDSEIARREETLIASERNIANAEDNLKLLLNSEEWQASIIPGDTPVVIPEKPDLKVTLENVLANRPDIRASELLVDRAEILVDKAEDDLKPSLSLSGTAGMKGEGDSYGNSLEDSFSDPKFNWQVGLILQVPLGNRSSRGALARERAKLMSARQRSELLRQEAKRSAREAVRNVNLALKTIEATRKTSLASQKRLEAEQAKFEVGLATANDVLEFQDSYAQALISEKRALIDLSKARAELDRVQGIVRFSNRQGEQSISNSIKAGLFISGEV
jgi:outer membrane protein TolC